MKDLGNYSIGVTCVFWGMGEWMCRRVIVCYGKANGMLDIIWYFIFSYMCSTYSRVL